MACEMSDQIVNENDVFRILVATDNHLGYNENDALTGNDSFATFEEILSLARTNDVDFTLLGGDLFHDPNPSQNSLNKCLKLLRTHALGDRSITMEFISDQSENFHNCLATVNYEDANINIAHPVFSIHGNHDDPTGLGAVSSLDLLSNAGLVNYFGKCLDLTSIKLKPILLRKGRTQLALYGLSHIHDNRLVRLFEARQVLMECPPEDSGNWFNILVLHQNRADRGVKNYIPENVLPAFFHLVIWGHEHDCRITPEVNPTHGFSVIQPGSSVATSLSEGESIEKCVGLLEIKESEFKLTPLKLKTIRPFIFESIGIADIADDLRLDEGDADKKLQTFAKDKLEEMIKKAEDKLTGHEDQPRQPLIRLRLVYSNEKHLFNTIRLGQRYSGQVANPSKCVEFKRNKRHKQTEQTPFDPSSMNNAFTNITDDLKVEDLVQKYFKGSTCDDGMQVMTPDIMTEFCRRIIENDDNHAADLIIAFTTENAYKFLNDKMPLQQDIDTALKNLQMNDKKIFTDLLKVLDARGESSLTSTDDKKTRNIKSTKKTSRNSQSKRTI